MNKYNDLELSILSCLLLNPSLMNKIILEDKYFVKYQKIWQFMKAFYKKFGNFDITLMVSISKDKYRMVEYIKWILDKEPTPTLFETYQKQIMDLYNEKKKDKWIIDKVYELANDLYVRNITIDEFKKKISKAYKDASELFDDNSEMIEGQTNKYDFIKDKEGNE